MIVTIVVYNAREDRSDALQLLVSDLPAVYGGRLARLVRGKTVVCGKLFHRICRVSE